MLKSVTILFAIALALANGEPISRNQRQGEFNRYYLYNRNINGVQMPLAGPPTGLIEGGVTVILIHGHGGSYLTSLNPDVRREILGSNENANVIAVDWSLIASMPYAQAQAWIESVADFLFTFIRNNNIAPSNLHLVGFNLGAHIAGHASFKLGRAARVTGLDPSASNFIKLSRFDATYVEVIHTDASGTVLSNGIPDQMGHADFYPNGGRVQPGCANNACHHQRAWWLFAASIRDNPFNANCCETILQKDTNTCRLGTLPMGNNTLLKYPCESRIYRVNTGMTYPF